MVSVPHPTTAPGSIKPIWSWLIHLQLQAAALAVVLVWADVQLLPGPACWSHGIPDGLMPPLSPPPQK